MKSALPVARLNSASRAVSLRSVLTALLPASLTVLHAADAPSKALAKPPNTVPPEFAPITDDPKLPRVLLMGDSVSIACALDALKLDAGSNVPSRLREILVHFCAGHPSHEAQDRRWHVRHAAAQGFTKPAKAYGLCLLDSFKRFDGRLCIALNNFLNTERSRPRAWRFPHLRDPRSLQ